MKTENRRLIRIIVVGAIVGGIAGLLNYRLDKAVKSATRA